jgi:hypothetical protein
MQQATYLLFTSENSILCLLDIGSESSCQLPTYYVLLLSPNNSLFWLNLDANLTFFIALNYIPNQSHTANFTSSILFAAMLSEMAPLPASAGQGDEVEEAHCEDRLACGKRLHFGPGLAL